MGGFDMWRLASLILLAGLLFSAPALAATATLKSVEGPISIDRGIGFLTAGPGTTAKTGDRLMAGPGGNAKLVYTDGCTVSIRPGSVVSVGEKSPCKADYMVGGKSLALDPQYEQKNLGLLPFVVGAGIIFGVACGVSFCDDDDHPVSP